MEQRPRPSLDNVREAMRQHDEREAADTTETEDDEPAERNGEDDDND